VPAQAVLFDIDGTLVDSVDLHAQAWQEALAHFGHRVAFEEIRAQIGKGGDQFLPVFLSEDELSLRGKTIEDFRGELYKSKYFKRVRAFPGVRPLFKDLLRRGLRIALASSAKGDELETYKEIAGIADLIHAESSKDDAARSKPHPDIFDAALRRLGGDVDRHRVFVVGDTPWDASRRSEPESAPSASSAAVSPRRTCAPPAAWPSTAIRKTFTRGWTNHR